MNSHSLPRRSPGAGAAPAEVHPDEDLKAEMLALVRRLAARDQLLRRYRGHLDGPAQRARRALALLAEAQRRPS
jgi:hypothetical protein